MLEALAGNEASYRTLLADVAVRLRAYYGRRLPDEHASASEDLVQDTLIALHTRRFTYDVNRPFTAWLYAIARYKLVDQVRTTRGRRHVPIDEVDDLVAPEASDVSIAQMDLDRLLDTIPAKTRDLVRAVKIEGRSISEASAASGLSEAAVKVSIHRALKRLANRIKAFGKP